MSQFLFISDSSKKEELFISTPAGVYFSFYFLLTFRCCHALLIIFAWKRRVINFNYYYYFYYSVNRILKQQRRRGQRQRQKTSTARFTFRRVRIIRPVRVLLT